MYPRAVGRFDMLSGATEREVSRRRGERCREETETERDRDSDRDSDRDRDRDRFRRETERDRDKKHRLRGEGRGERTPAISSSCLKEAVHM